MADKKKDLENEVADMLMDDFDKFEHIYATYWKQIVWGCVGFVVVVAIVATVVAMNQSVANEAYAAFGAAKSVEEINTAVDEYPNSLAVIPAKFRLAKLYFDKKEYEKALSAYTEIANSGKKEQMVWRAKLNRAYITELNGKKEEAATIFNEIAFNSEAPMLVKSEAAYGAGRLYKDLKNPDKAKSILESAKTAQRNFWSNQATRLLEILNSQG